MSKILYFRLHTAGFYKPSHTHSTSQFGFAIRILLPEPPGAGGSLLEMHASVIGSRLTSVFFSPVTLPPFPLF